jgi:hypothetical protein
VGGKYVKLLVTIRLRFDDLRRTAGRSWMRVAEDRARWREIGEAYVQQLTVYYSPLLDCLLADDDDDDDSVTCSNPVEANGTNICVRFMDVYVVTYV